MVMSLAALAATGRPWAVAHRGYSGRFPENTMAAFEAAVAAGADTVELDVHLTADRVPVVIHDRTVDRTTDASGAVSDLTWADLERLDAGSWFAPSFAGQRIPSLEEALAYLGRQVTVNVELKPEAFEDPAPADAVEAQVAALVERMGLLDAVAVSSFEHRCVARFARIVPEVARVLLYEDALDVGETILDCRRHGADACGPAAHLLRPEAVALLGAAGIRVIPWAVDDEPTMRRLLDWGVGGLITNEIETLRRVLEDRS
jgi:glycerophosphoryl diester phosphodiesterase